MRAVSSDRVQPAVRHRQARSCSKAHRSSLYWIAAGDILGIIAVVLSAWVLMVEILR